MNPESERQLERFVTAATRGIPSRSAPAGLEGRVLAEVARRAALPWWRKSFAHWPRFAQAAFVVLSLGAIRLVFAAQGAFPARGRVDAATAAALEWLRLGNGLATSALRTAEAALGAAPAGWIYALIATVVAMYLAVFGLGAAAYRALWVSR